MKEMLDKNYEAWKEVYEKTYNKKLTYLCDEKDDKKPLSRVENKELMP